ncbi:PhzF family phenazine biosynthesis protein [Microbacterium sp. T2.11-28]|uniref:PhzF family phenazine biosynthesis protein n=1 Tax=Microbacterium sp. T2.11-28 TaxID=3041169 RepID=UPI0025409865|nr:PhzF family phenazine biosynthesis isomerase [Microbacterium sp. T2.11-28]
MPQILRLAAFSTDPSGGNPAGVVLDAEALDDAAMQRIAAEVDYAETAFVTGRDADGLTIRYFSPIAEVPFCGHATVATAVALVERALSAPGELTFRTPVGPVAIRTARVDDGVTASFTSVDPYVEELPADVLAEVLDELGIGRGDLDPRMPPALAFAGNRHPVIALADREIFDSFTFDPVRVRALMDAQDWRGTVTVLHAPRAGVLREITARNLFPVGRITEDPATGSAAASVGAYLRAGGLVAPPASVTIHQGAHVGRPGVLEVAIPVAGGITVTGRAVEIA